MSDKNKELNELELLKLKVKIGREAVNRLRELNIRMQKKLKRLKNSG